LKYCNAAWNVHSSEAICISRMTNLAMTARAFDSRLFFNRSRSFLHSFSLLGFSNRMWKA